MLASRKRDLPAARRFCVRVLRQSRPAQARLRPMRGLKRFRSVQTISAGHAFVQNIRRGHYDLATETEGHLPLAATFTELAQAV